MSNKLLTFNEYQSMAEKYRVYPDDQKITYPILGLISEVGEFAALFKREIRDGTDERDTEAMIDELGDILWYTEALASDLGIKLSNDLFNSLDVQALHFSQRAYTQKTLYTLCVCLAYEAVDFANDAINLQEKAEDYNGYVNSVLCIIAKIACKLDTNLEHVAQRNLAKLANRAERGVIKGKGGDR